MKDKSEMVPRPSKGDQLDHDGLPGARGHFYPSEHHYSANACLPSYTSFMHNGEGPDYFGKLHVNSKSLNSQSCDQLVGHLGVYNVWIALFDGKDVMALASSFEKSFSPMEDYIQSGKCPYCMQKAKLQENER